MMFLLHLNNQRFLHSIFPFKGFFKTYKAFTEEQIDTLEIMLVKVYQRFNINEKTDLSVLEHDDYPILSDSMITLMKNTNITTQTEITFIQENHCVKYCFY